MRKRRLAAALLFSSVCTLSLSGCSWAWLKDWPPSEYKDVDYNNTEQTMQPPQYQVMRSAEGTWIQENPQTQSQAQPVMSEEERTSKLRAERASDSINRRMARLEETVDDMRRDLEAIMPALRRMVDAQNDLQKALKKVEPEAGYPVQNMSGNNNFRAGQADPTVILRDAMVTPQNQTQRRQAAIEIQQLAPGGSAASHVGTVQNTANIPSYTTPAYSQKAVQNPQQQNTRAQAASFGSDGFTKPVVVRQFRLGEHSDKTRLVLDASADVTYRYDIDNGENIMLIEMPGVVWQDDVQRQYPKSPLIHSFTAVPTSSGGTNLAIQLRRNVKVGWANTLPSLDGQSRRVIFDLIPQ